MAVVKNTQRPVALLVAHIRAALVRVVAQCQSITLQLIIMRSGTERYFSSLRIGEVNAHTEPEGCLIVRGGQCLE